MRVKFVNADVLEAAFGLAPHVGAAAVVVVPGAVPGGPVRHGQGAVALAAAQQAGKDAVAPWRATDYLRPPGVHGRLHLLELFRLDDRRVAVHPNPEVRWIGHPLAHAVENAHATVDLAGQHVVDGVFRPPPATQKNARVVQGHRDNFHPVTLPRHAKDPAHGFRLAGVWHQPAPLAVLNSRITERHPPAHEIAIRRSLEHRAARV
ncbi:MAG: hypothetical protein Q8L17_09115 [Polaromonas sp.]|nr:hypothetical protein [Polaromonas sp.]MDP1886606.1 hypothetical protein [Polaromonas sp.]